jgi:hypothetical protein
MPAITTKGVRPPGGGAKLEKENQSPPSSNQVPCVTKGGSGGANSRAKLNVPSEWNTQQTGLPGGVKIIDPLYVLPPGEA